MLMNGLRKFGLAVALLIYFPLLLTFANVFSFNRTIARPEVVKQNLKQAGVYGALSKFILEQTQKNPEVTGSPIITKSVEQVVTPEGVQSVAEPTIDNIYAWLNDPQGKAPLAVAIEPLKKKLIETVNENLKQQLSGLPACTKASPARTSDPLTINCIPPGTSVESLLAQVQQQLASQNVLPQSDTVNLNGDTPENPVSPEIAQPDATAQPVNNKPASPVDTQSLQLLAKIYRITKASEPYLIGLVVLATIGIIALSRPFTQGVKRLGKLIIPAGLILFFTAWVTNIFATKYFGVEPGTAPTIATAFEEALKLTALQMIRIARTFSIVYLASGFALLFGGIIASKVFDKKKPANPDQIEKDNMLPDDDKKLEDKPDEKAKPVEPPKEEKVAEPTEDPSETKIDVK